MTQLIRQDTEVCALNIHLTLNNFKQSQVLLDLSPEFRPTASGLPDHFLPTSTTSVFCQSPRILL